MTRRGRRPRRRPASSGPWPGVGRTSSAAATCTPSATPMCSASQPGRMTSGRTTWTPSGCDG